MMIFLIIGWSIICNSTTVIITQQAITAPSRRTFFLLFFSFLFSFFSSLFLWILCYSFFVSHGQTQEMTKNKKIIHIVKMACFLQGKRIPNFFHADALDKVNIPLDRTHLGGELSMSRSSQYHRIGSGIGGIQT